MILDLAIVVARGLEQGREYEAGGVAVYCVPGIYGGRVWAVLGADGEEVRCPTPQVAALAFIGAAGVEDVARARKRAVEAARERGWRRVA